MKKKPATTSKPPPAVKPQAQAENALPPILGGAIPEDGSIHLVNVRPDGELFRLWNRDMPCGSRLIKGDGFPLSDTKVGIPEVWEAPFWLYRTLDDAEVAAQLLQDYLDKHDKKKKS